MIKLKRNPFYKKGDIDCIFFVEKGDLRTPIKKVGYRTTLNDWEEFGDITDKDIKELVVYCSPEGNKEKTTVFVSIDKYLFFIFVGVFNGCFFDNTKAVEKIINKWVKWIENDMK